MIPPALRGRFGALWDEGELWGYLHVRDDELVKRGLFGIGRTRVLGELLIEEFFRISPPAPDAVDWADSLGWSDTVVRPDDIPDEVARLTRGELLLTGRTLKVVWLEGPEAEDVRDQYFAPSKL